MHCHLLRPAVYQHRQMWSCVISPPAYLGHRGASQQGGGVITGQNTPQAHFSFGSDIIRSHIGKKIGIMISVACGPKRRTSSSGAEICLLWNSNEPQKQSGFDRH